jgi:hypothetical protein
MTVKDEIYGLARGIAGKKPLNESVWLLSNKEKRLIAYITSPSVTELRGMTGYCTVAIARNLRNPQPDDIIREWAYDICGEVDIDVDRALDIIEREVSYIANVLA